MTPEQEAHARMEAPWHPILRIVLEALDVERARMAELEETLNTKVEHLPPGMMREYGRLDNLWQDKNEIERDLEAKANTYHVALSAIANVHPGALNAGARCAEIAIDALVKEATDEEEPEWTVGGSGGICGWHQGETDE